MDKSFEFELAQTLIAFYNAYNENRLEVQNTTYAGFILTHYYVDEDGFRTQEALNVFDIHSVLRSIRSVITNGRL